MLRRVGVSLKKIAYDSGLLKAPTWEQVASQENIFLYAGALTADLPQYRTHYGLTPYKLTRRTIHHDVLAPLPLATGSVQVYQSEDVFEHIPLEDLPKVLEEIYRVLREGGLFRLSLPDYRFNVYYDRSLKNEAGQILFDEGGGGRLVNGNVVDGGHVWFPTLESVDELFKNSRFARDGEYEILHATKANGSYVLKPIDYRLGHVMRTPDHDLRGQNPRRPVSIVVDAWKGKPAPDETLKALRNAE